MKIIIGRTERVDLKALSLFGLDAKIDTGAYTPSLHCHNIEVNEEENEVFFTLLDPEHPEYDGKRIHFPISSLKNVKSSNGTVEKRVFIYTTITLFGEEYETDISLTDRSSMKYPMLLGRDFLKNKFIVDVSLQYQNKGKNTC